MREIKFRAYDTETKEMCYEFLDRNWLLVSIKSPFVELMQYLEISDKNGRDIFEGDIVEEPYFSNVNPSDHDDEDYIDNTPRKYVICYDSKQAKYKMVPISTYLINAGNGGWTGYEVKYERISIIGNVHENPELLN